MNSNTIHYVNLACPKNPKNFKIFRVNFLSMSNNFLQLFFPRYFGSSLCNGTERYGRKNLHYIF